MGVSLEKELAAELGDEEKNIYKNVIKETNYHDMNFWRRYSKHFNPEKAVNTSSFLSAGIAAARLPEEKLREWYEIVAEGKSSYYNFFDVVEVFNPDMSVDDLFTSASKRYKEMQNSLSDKDLRWGLIMMEALSAAEEGYLNPYSDVRDAYMTAREFFKKNIGGSRRATVTWYDEIFCKPIGYVDDLVKISKILDSPFYEALETIAFYGISFGKYVGELLTLVGGISGGTKILARTPLGDLSREIFKGVLKESPSMAAKPGFMDLVINSQTILPLMVSAAIAAPAAWYVGNKIEEKLIEVEAAAEDMSGKKCDEAIDKKAERILRDIDKGFEILCSRGPTTPIEWKVIQEQRDKKYRELYIPF